MSVNMDVHTEHCCNNCGCAYDGGDRIVSDDGSSYIPCSVVAGRFRQNIACGKTSVCWESEFLDNQNFEDIARDGEY